MRSLVASRWEPSDEKNTAIVSRLPTTAQLQNSLESERNVSQEKLALLLDAKTALTDQFKALANEILEEKSKRFTEQNQSNLGARSLETPNHGVSDQDRGQLAACGHRKKKGRKAKPLLVSYKRTFCNACKIAFCDLK